MSILELEQLDETHLNAFQTISGKFFAGKTGNGTQCWLAPIGATAIDNDWIDLGSDSIYDFLRPQMEPRGGGRFLFAYDAIVSGRLVANTTTSRRSIFVEQLRLEDEDGDIIALDIPETFRISVG